VWTVTTTTTYCRNDFKLLCYNLYRSLGSQESNTDILINETKAAQAKTDYQWAELLSFLDFVYAFRATKREVIVTLRFNLSSLKTLQDRY